MLYIYKHYSEKEDEVIVYSYVIFTVVFIWFTAGFKIVHLKLLLLDFSL
jgi:hypothetical protein